MAASSTYNQSGGLRQDLLNVMTLVSKFRTPLVNKLKHVAAKDRIHNFTYAQIVGSGANNINAQVENFTIVTNAAQAYTQAYNWTQIIAWPFNVSRTQTKVDYAGVSNYIAGQTEIALQNVAMDLETSLIQATGNSGTSAAGRVMKGLLAWATATTATGSSTAFNTSAGVAILEPFLQAIWEQGNLCTPDTLIVNAAQKAGVDSWSTPVTRWIDAKDNKLSYMINVYQSSFSAAGGLEIMIDQAMPALSVVAMNADGLAIAYLDKPHVEELAKTTDGFQYNVVTECTLEVKNPFALGTLVLS